MPDVEIPFRPAAILSKSKLHSVVFSKRNGMLPVEVGSARRRDLLLAHGVVEEHGLGRDWPGEVDAGLHGVRCVSRCGSVRLLFL